MKILLISFTSFVLIYSILKVTSGQNDPQDPRLDQDQIDVPDPSDPQPNTPQGAKLRKIITIFCKRHTKDCINKIKLYRRWCIQDQQWCQRKLQMQDLFMDLCAKHPSMCTTPDPPDTQPHHPQGPRMGAQVELLCMKSPFQCKSKQLQFDEWCLLDPEWCNPQQQKQAMYNYLCPLYPIYCNQGALDMYWKTYLQKQQQQLYKQLDNICLDNPFICGNYNKLQGQCKNELECGFQELYLQKKYIQICKLDPNQCNSDILELALQNQLSDWYITSLK